MFKGAEEGTFTICAHSSLPQSAWELCKIDVTTYPCKLPKPNPEAISIYSASTMRCFMLKRNIKHVFMASLDHWQKKGNIQESLTCCTHTGKLPQETGPPKSLTLPCLAFPETTGVWAQGIRRREPTLITSFIQLILTF